MDESLWSLSQEVLSALSKQAFIFSKRVLNYVE